MIQLFIEEGDSEQIFSLVKWIIDLPIKFSSIGITYNDSYIVLEYKDIQAIRENLNSIEDYYEGI